MPLLSLIHACLDETVVRALRVAVHVDDYWNCDVGGKLAGATGSVQR